ncbi:MAG: hypothetical protein IH940_02930 [Acidobacteria bacterium]|nr:hypothetical protein [Acidobacteriota bacterium]
MDKNLFANVDDIVRSLYSGDVDQLFSKSHRYGVKIWIGTPEPPKVHYEAQVLGRHHVDGEEGLAVEIGLHCEHRDEAENESILNSLLERSKKWEPVLGEEASAGVFYGAENWRRLSDVWIEPDLSVDDIDVEIASRMTDYIETLQPLLPEDPT